MRKLIVIASAVVSILYSFFFMARIVKDTNFISHGVWHTRAIGQFIFMGASILLLDFISLLVIFNRQLPKVFSILFKIISIILATFSISISIGFLFRLITQEIQIHYIGIINIVSLIPINITLLTYIRRALKPTEVKENK